MARVRRAPSPRVPPSHAGLQLTPPTKYRAFMEFIIKAALRGARIFCKATRPSRALPCGVRVALALCIADHLPFYHRFRLNRYNTNPLRQMVYDTYSASPVCGRLPFDGSRPPRPFAPRPTLPCGV